MDISTGSKITESCWYHNLTRKRRGVVKLGKSLSGFEPGYKGARGDDLDLANPLENQQIRIAGDQIIDVAHLSIGR